jgi:hypothetical protein
MKKRTALALALGFLLLFPSVRHAAYAAAQGIRAAFFVFYTQSSSQPTGTSGGAGKDRIWVKSTVDHIIFTDTSNVDHDISVGGPVTTLTDAATINTDASLSQAFKVTLGGNRTLANPTNLVSGATYLFLVVQDGTGSRTLAYGNLFTWPGGTVPTLSTGANAVDLITAVYDGTKLRAVWNGNFQ